MADGCFLKKCFRFILFISWPPFPTRLPIFRLRQPEVYSVNTALDVEDGGSLGIHLVRLRYVRCQDVI